MCVATSLGHVDYHIRSNPERGFTEYSPGVVAGTESAPGRYRILAPYLYTGVTRVTSFAPRESWVLFRWMSLLASLYATLWYFSTWFDRNAAALASVALAALVPLTFTNGWAHPDHLVEWCLFTLGCACIARGRTAWFAIVLVANALNRETSAFLVPLFLLAAPITRRRLLQTAMLGGLWVAIFVGLRWWLGFQSYDPWQLGRNIEFLKLMPDAWDPYYRSYAWFVVIMAVPFVVAAIRTWPTLPRMVRASTVVVAPAFVLVGLLFSSIIETRIFTPLLPLLAPAVLFALLPTTGAPTNEREPQ